MDPRAGGYDQGFYAYWSGQGPADNPYAPDSADHLAWENGWSEALDEDFRWTGPRASREPALTLKRVGADRQPAVGQRPQQAAGSPSASPSQTGQASAVEDRRHPVVHRRHVGVRRRR